MLDQTYYKKTDEIIEHYGRKAASLIPIMQDIQAEYRYLPGELLTYVAEQIGVKEAKAYSVATFYENFSFEPKGKYIIKVCDGASPHAPRQETVSTVKSISSVVCFLWVSPSSFSMASLTGMDLRT